MSFVVCCSATSSSLRRRGAVGARDGHDTHRVGNTSTYVVSWDSEARGDGPISEGCVVGMTVVFPNFLWTLTLSNPFFPVYTVSFSYSWLGLQGNWRPTGLPKTSGVLQGARCWLADSYSFSPVVVRRFPDTPPSYANSSRCFRSQFSARSLGRSGRYPLRTDRSLPLSWGVGCPGVSLVSNSESCLVLGGQKGLSCWCFPLSLSSVLLLGTPHGSFTRAGLKFPDRSTWYVSAGRRGARGMGWVAPPGHRPLNDLWKFNSNHLGALACTRLAPHSVLHITRRVVPSRGSQVARHAESVALERAASLPIRRPIYSVLTWASRGRP